MFCGIKHFFISDDNCPYAGNKRITNQLKQKEKLILLINTANTTEAEEFFAFKKIFQYSVYRPWGEKRMIVIEDLQFWRNKSP